MTDSNIYKNNNWKLLASNIGNDSTFSLGVFVLFLLFVGLSLSQISIIISTLLIIMSLGSIPGGILADRLGYKKTLVYGGILFLVGTTVFAFGQNFYWFLLGYALIGVGIALKQATQSAFLFVSLQQEGKETDYKRIAGKIDFFTNIIWVVSSTLGGFLYAVNHRLPFYAEIFVAFVSLISIILLISPPTEKHNKPIIKQLKSALQIALNKPKFSKIFIASAFIGSIALLTIQYVQPLYKVLHVPDALFGILASCLFIMRGLGSWYSKQLGRFFSVDKYLVLHAATFGLFLVLIQKINSAFFVIPVLAILYFLRGLYNPTISTYINEKIDVQRATILSINNTILTIVTSVTLIFTGYIADKYNLQTVFFTISILSMVFLILYVISLRKVDTG